MTIRYEGYEGKLDSKLWESMTKLHSNLFGSPDDLLNRLPHNNRLILLAIHLEEVIGYKIGYALDDETFYSWIGGVDACFRKYGVASKLMKRQHEWAKASNYRKVQTKTLNKWRGMLILNLKSGFDITDTYTDGQGKLKIVLEKIL